MSEVKKLCFLQGAVTDDWLYACIGCLEVVVVFLLISVNESLYSSETTIYS